MERVVVVVMDERAVWGMARMMDGLKRCFEVLAEAAASMKTLLRLPELSANLRALLEVVAGRRRAVDRGGVASSIHTRNRAPETRIRPYGVWDGAPPRRRRAWGWYPRQM